MEKDKETKIRSWWQQIQQSPKFFRNLLICVVLIILLIVSVCLLLNRYINSQKSKDTLVNASTEAVVSRTPSVGVMPPSLSNPQKMETTSQDLRLTDLEKTVNVLVATSQVFHQFIAFEIVKEILEGHLSLESLKLFLQRHPDSWTALIVTILPSIQGSKTYDELQRLLVLSLPPQTLWERIQNFLKSIVIIRKMNQEGEEHIEAVRAALQERNVQKALEIFDKLPPEEKTQYASWQKAAQDRLALERLKQKMLLMISEH